MPDPGFEAPDLAGFAAAQEAKRQALGSDVIFLGKPANAWPPGTAINPDSGEPFDPTITPTSSTQQQTTIRCGVFFKAVNRGGAAGAAIGSPAGWEERTRIFAITPYDTKLIVDEAVEFIFHDEHYKIDVTKDDEIVLGFKRMLVYASATGS
jgi:hypothetical protein